MVYLLVVHITLGALLLVATVTRLLMVIFKGKDASAGRYLVVGLGGGLIASGVVLELITKAALTNVCLVSLGIVSAVIIYELGLQYYLNKLAVKEEVRIK